MVAVNTLRNLACCCPGRTVTLVQALDVFATREEHIETEIRVRRLVKIIGNIRVSIDRSILAAADRITESKAVAAIIRALKKSAK
jgi:hypothetical protein